jgi:hypothetical protein
MAKSLQDLEQLLQGSTEDLVPFLANELKRKMIGILLTHKVETLKKLSVAMECAPGTITDIIKYIETRLFDLNWFIIEKNKISKKIHPPKSIRLTPDGIDYVKIFFKEFDKDADYLTKFKAGVQTQDRYSSSAKEHAKSRLELLQDEREILKRWLAGLPYFDNNEGDWCRTLEIINSDRPSTPPILSIPYNPEDDPIINDDIPSLAKECHQTQLKFNENIKQFRNVKSANPVDTITISNLIAEGQELRTNLEHCLKELLHIL